MRCTHEAQLHTENSFLTLTIDDEHMPEDGSLDKRHLQLFFKRLRKSLNNKLIRYYACGEYGEKTRRAHYHVCLFGHDFSDKIQFTRRGDHTLYISPTLTQLWGMGQTSIGDLNFETAAYTARYVMKKQTGLAKGMYAQLDEQTGEIIQLQQPFAVMSLRCRGADGKTGGIGSEWIRRYHKDIYNHEKDFIVMRGRKMKPARYYDEIYDTINPEHLAIIKAQRYKENEGQTQQQLDARASIAHARNKAKTQI